MLRPRKRTLVAFLVAVETVIPAPSFDEYLTLGFKYKGIILGFPSTPFHVKPFLEPFVVKPFFSFRGTPALSSLFTFVNAVPPENNLPSIENVTAVRSLVALSVIVPMGEDLMTLPTILLPDLKYAS